MMTLTPKGREVLKAKIAAVGWDNRSVELDDLRFLAALTLAVRPQEVSPTAEEERIGISLRRTGSLKVVATDLSTRESVKAETARQALGILRQRVKQKRLLQEAVDELYGHLADD